MKKYLTTFCLMLASLFGTSHVIAQNENEIEEVAESIEAIAEQLGNVVGEFGDQIEIVMDENSDELEAWAAKYESQWEEWAESLESRLESWAEEQEQVWEEWAEKYSQKWEEWAEELDGGEMEPEQVNRMIRRNLKMLGDMPLGELVEGLMKEGTQGFESAPWESLSDLQSMFQESIERTVKETERRVAAAQKNSTKQRRGRATGGVVGSADSDELDYILPVIEQQQAGLQAKEKALASEAEAIFNQIRDKLSSGKASKADVAELMKLIQKQDTYKAKAKANFETAKALAKAKAKLRTQAESVENARKQNRELQSHIAQQRRKLKETQSEAKKRLSQSLERVRKRQQSDKTGETDQKTPQMRRVIEALEGEEMKLQDKNRELELLRKEVEQLRSEFKKLAKERADK